MSSTVPAPGHPVLDIRDLRVHVPGRQVARIVNGVSWSVAAGETLAVVGESGSGKTMTALSATGLAPEAARVSGDVRLLGEDLLNASAEARRKARGRHIGFVFQDPMTSLNPLLPVGRQIGETCEEHLGWSPARARVRALELLEKVGIQEPGRRIDEFPHQFSGGMRQRVMIAAALACEPAVLIADEPTTALDVTTQAQILELVRDLQRDLGTAVVWITHDLGVVAGIADRVVVMYGGQVVEQTDVDRLFEDPRHPYTEGLLAARPRLGDVGDDLVAIAGSPPQPTQLPSGCAFHPRCHRRSDSRCADEPPPLTQVAPQHWARTWCDLGEQR
ncbi:MAG: ABC transporter ATP-binding protein [Actinomycetota bacterium]|nr:ABC transporter ATP-binding protein [Actinomycetota bacterium]